MQLKLSCYCCGNEDFEHTEIEGLLEIEGRSYVKRNSLASIYDIYTVYDGLRKEYINKRVG